MLREMTLVKYYKISHVLEEMKTRVLFSYSKIMTNFEVFSLVNSSSMKPLVCEECADAAGLYRSVSSSNKLTYTMTPLSLSLEPQEIQKDYVG